MNKQIRKFGVRDQFGYTCGDMGGSFVNLYVDAFFLTFCTYVLGISATWMGGLFLIARLWDAINDPLIGSLPDRFTIGKSGDKFKPYVKIAMWPLALSCLFCFMDVSSWSSVMKHAWAAFAYIFYGMSYTGTSMPYGSMASVITNDPIERTKLSRARSIGGLLVGGIAISIVPQFVYDDAGEIVPPAFLGVAAVFALCSIICYFLLLNCTTERVHQEKKEKQKFNYGKVLKEVVHNRPLIGVMVASIGSLLYITANTQLGTYLYKEYYHAPSVMTLVSLLIIPVIIILFPLVPSLTKRFGKRAIIIFATSFNLVVSTFLLLVPISNVYVFIVINAIAVAGQTAFTMLIWAFVTDCIDYNEYMTGDRNDGSLYSIYTFSRKIGSTLASSLASFALGAVGYVSGLNVVQADGVAEHIRLLATSVPVITCILELIGIGLIYNLSKTKAEKMYVALKERREK